MALGKGENAEMTEVSCHRNRRRSEGGQWENRGPRAHNWDPGCSKIRVENAGQPRERRKVLEYRIAWIGRCSSRWGQGYGTARD